MGEMATGTSYTHDLGVVVAVAIMTMTIQSQVPFYFERKVPGWNSLRPGTRSRICVETAVIPSRIMLAYMTLPIIFNGFSPIENWTPEDTISALLASSVLTGAYIVDLTVTRNNKGATVHHIMGPALLFWIRLKYASFTPADALMCRLLMSFVFFGAIFSGSTTTALMFVFHFRKVWFKKERDISNKAYYYFSLLLPALATSTICGNFYCTLYLHAWFDEMFAHFGHWGYVPLAWVLLECSMQWKWAIWFFKSDVAHRTQFAEGEQDLIDSSNIWWLPKWRFAFLEVMKYIWYMTYVGVIWRGGDIQWLSGLFAEWCRKKIAV